MNKRVVTYGRALLSLAIILYLITMLDWNRIRYVLPKLRLEFVAQAYVLVLFSVLASSVRWSTLLKQFNVVQGVFDSWRYYLISMFYGVMLPGVIGGDVVRLGLSIKHHGMSMKGMLTSIILFERICGLMAIIMIFAVMVSFAPEILGGEQMFSNLVYILPFAAIASIALSFIALKKAPESWFSRAGRHRLIERTYSLLQRLRNVPAVSLLAILILSLLVNFMDILGSYFLARALNMSVSFYFFLLIIPMTYVMTALPISLGGLGVREGVLAFFLVKVGVMASDAVLLAFLIYLNRLAVALIGGIAQLAGKNRHR